MDGRRRYPDTIFIERLWRSRKQETVHLHKLQTGFHANRVIDEWPEFHNAERPHTALYEQTRDDTCLEATQMNKAA